MNKQNYQLIVTGCMVSALDPQGPTLIGTVWRPHDRAELEEAVALRNIGYAEETTLKATVKTRAELADKGSETADTTTTPKLSGIKEAGILQDDGTFKNKAGERVHKDGSEFREGDEKLLEAVLKPADDIIAAVSAADISDELRAALPRLAELEPIYKDRKTVNAALAAALQPKSE